MVSSLKYGAFDATSMLMTTPYQAAVLAMAIILAPATAMAASLINLDASPTPTASAKTAGPADEALPSPRTFPGAIHWAMLSVGAAFAGVAFYIQRRRGFDLD